MTYIEALTVAGVSLAIIGAYALGGWLILHGVFYILSFISRHIWHEDRRKAERRARRRASK